jgi:hypothetical protein
MLFCLVDVGCECVFVLFVVQLVHQVALHLVSGYLYHALPVLPRTTVVAPILDALLALCRVVRSNPILQLQAHDFLSSSYPSHTARTSILCFHFF